MCITESDFHSQIDEEDWSLKDVIFVEDSRNVPVGRVLKVDGPYAAVKFPATASSASAASSASTSGGGGPPINPPPPKEPKLDPEDSLLNESTRLLRKDELQVSLVDVFEIEANMVVVVVRQLGWIHLYLRCEPPCLGNRQLLNHPV